MSDLNKEALDVWGALKPMIDQEISSRTQGMVQRRKAKVTTAPSLATNTIGVTEAFGDEMFLPFVSNMISAKVGDFVWIEWMYGATNAFVSCFAEVDEKDFTVAGSLDVVSRRCYNTSLSTSGWYRICVCNNATAYPGAEGSFVNFYITRAAGFTYNEVHKISLATNYNRFEFLGEESFSSVLGIDKIRVTFNSTSRNLYVDIHYNLSQGNAVTARIDPYWTIYKDTVSVGEKYWVAESMQSVSDSPSGETVLTEYSFNANGTGDVTVNGVLDVTQRRCYATLSSAGWYRVFNVTGGLGRAGSSFTITLHIGRSYNNINNELHTVTLLANYYNQEFSSEVSKSNSLGIRKVRYTADGSNNGHIDIYYDLTSENFVYVDFDVHCRPENAYLIRYNAVTPTAVAASPSGETVVKEYSFSGNTEGAGTITAGSYTESFYDGTYLYRQGQMVTGFIKAKMNATVPASAWRNIAVIPVGFRPYSSIDFFAIDNSNSGTLQARIEQSTGNVNIWPYTAIASGTAIYLSFTYRAYSTN